MTKRAILSVPHMASKKARGLTFDRSTGFADTQLKAQIN